VLAEALALLANPQELYRQSDEAGKRLLTLTLFDELYVDTYSVTGHELNEPFAALVSVQKRQTPAAATQPSLGRTYAARPS
jgi:hypothetical protein